MGTVIKEFGLDTTAYTPAAYEVPEDADVVRDFYFSASDNNGDDTLGDRDQYLVHYQIRGDAKNLENWEIVSDTPIEYPFYGKTGTDG